MHTINKLAFSSEKVTKLNLSQAILLHVVLHSKQPSRGYLNESYKCPPNMSKPAHIAEIALRIFRNDFSAAVTESIFGSATDVAFR